MSRHSLIRLLSIVVAIALPVTDLQAYTNEWSWRELGSSVSFPTKTQAIAYVRSHTSDPRYALLTNESTVYMSDTSERVLLTGEPVDPILGDWVYFNVEVAGPGGPHASESALIDAWIQAAPGDPECGGTNIVGLDSWATFLTLSQYGNALKEERREYRRTIPNYLGGTCHFSVDQITFSRSRSVSCPSGYAGAGPVKPGCKLNFSANIIGARNNCEDNCANDAKRGNPVQAMTGNKHETEIDYTGPGGLTLIRSYHTKSLDRRARMGAGWMTNWHRSIASENFGGFTRADGYNENLDAITSSHYISNAAERIQMKKISSSIWHMLYPDGRVDVYNTSGKLLETRTPGGAVTTITYDEHGWLGTVTGPFGHELKFEYENNKVARVRLPDGLYIEYEYTGSVLTRVTYADGTSREYHYEHATFTEHLTGITDESANRFSTFAYDSTGRATLSEHAGGIDRYQFVYNTSNTVVTDPLGTNETISFTTTSNLARRMTQSSKPGQLRVYTLPSASTDVARRMTQETDPNGRVRRYTYDSFHRTSVTEAFGTPLARTTTYGYLTNDNSLPTLITGANRTTSFTYDGYKVLTRTVTDTTVTPNVSRTWTYTYDTYGRVLTEDGPRTDVSDVTTYSYYTCTTGNECGQLHTVTNALGHTTTYNSYNADGKPTQITDANGLVTSLAYDLRQRLTDRCVGGTLPSCAGGELTHLDYWPTGLLKKATNPDGSFIQYTYDPAHRLTQINDAAGNKVVYTLDNAGNRTAENTYDPSLSLRRTHSRVFNALSQLWKDVNAAGTAAVTTTFGYDNNGNQTSVAAPLGRNSSSLYDELNRLKQITDPASGVTLFDYDANDNLTSVTDPRSLVTSYGYNGFGDLLTQTSPDTGVTTNTYDSAGNLDTSTDSRGAITDYSYDAANRVTSVSFTLGGFTDQTINYGYDGGPNQNGRLTSASDADHTLAWTYDAHGRITGKGQTVGGTTLAMGYGYSPSGQLGTITLPSGNVVSLSYNANGQVSGLTLNGSTPILSGLAYDPFGPITGWTWGNGTTASRAFDIDGKVTQVDNANGASLKNYAYDDAFRITGISDALDPALSWTYGYDALDRLNAASKTGTTQGWTYDANGNRLSETGSTPSTYTTSSTSNRVSSISGSLPRSYAYDNAGNTLSYGGATFTYNHRGRMQTASNAGTTATYTYNARGQRIRRATSSVTTLYVYDEAGHLAGEYTAAGALVQETVWLGDVPVATIRPNGAGGVNLFYVHVDHLNTPRLVTDTANNIRWRWDSDAFGTTPPNENPSGLGTFEYNLRFPGQQYDQIVGLHYNYFRDYDPAVGRYVESDPIGIRSGVNTYAYVRLKPLIKRDPLGLCEDCEPNRAHYQYKSDAARAMLAKFNPKSIAEDVEYCGRICQDRMTKKYFAMQEARGSKLECPIMSAQSCPACSVWVAWWHTHGAYSDKDQDGKDDFNADHFSSVRAFGDNWISNSNGVDAFLATPGGQILFHGKNTGDSEIDYGEL